jgi:septal ring factor EnvC (AmiA/AmiB activator)
MTVEERFERIEHVTAMLVEERKKDREEYRQLWRDTQRRIDELTLKIAETNETVSRLAVEAREQDRRLGERIDALAAESHDADRRLGERIDSLVSAIGQFLSKQNPR